MVIANWDDDRRRSSSYAALGVAAVILLGALGAWWFLATTPAWLYWTLVAILVLVLAFMVLLFVLKPRVAEDVAAEAAPAEAAVAAPAEAAPAQAYEPRVLTLRCGDCGTIFDVNDTGERPLYHTCPGCAAEGALRDPVETPSAADQAYAPPQEAAMDAEPARPAPAPVHAASPAAPGAAPKKLKLRCGGCKEVFSIEDSGERPLKRGCPNCGRMGIIR